VKLLVSVSDADEALDGLSGGADVIDAKNPHHGTLGAVSMDTLHAIRAAVAGRRPVSAALDEAIDEHQIERRAAAFVTAGASFVKVGVGRITNVEQMAALAAAAVRGAASAARTGRPLENPDVPLPAEGLESGGVILVGYADATPRSTSDAALLIEAAVRVSAAGVLLDTQHKDGPGLRALVDFATLERWVALAHASRLIVALAGKLTSEDLGFVRDAGADIAGVRGAACAGGRTGRVVAARVQQLRSALASSSRLAATS
jgi:uncharacterized protein (UPF0264 family)